MPKLRSLTLENIAARYHGRKIEGVGTVQVRMSQGGSSFIADIGITDTATANFPDTFRCAIVRVRALEAGGVEASVVTPCEGLVTSVAQLRKHARLTDIAADMLGAVQHLSEQFPNLLLAGV